MLIGLSSKKSGGKDTAFEYIKTLVPDIKLFKFADPLKEYCHKVLGLTWEGCYGTEEDKNALSHLRWENFPIPVYRLADGSLKAFTQGYSYVLAYNYNLSLEVKPPTIPSPSPFRMKGYITNRLVVQFFAEEICRKMYPDCFVNKTMNDILDVGSENSGLTDVRYINEVKAIQNAGGKVIRFTRNIYQDSHRSETELDNYEGFDVVINNQDMNVDTKNFLIKTWLITWGGCETMKKVPIAGTHRHGEMAIVDDDIYCHLIGHNLKFKDDSARGRESYVYFHDKTKKKYIRLHRFVMNETNKNVMIDHIDGNPLNNQRKNLRFSTRTQNNQNRMGCRGSVSKYKGVSKLGKRWRAQLMCSGKYYLLGVFETEEEAARNYDWWAIRLFKDFAKLNFNHEDYYDFIPKVKPEGWIPPDDDKNDNPDTTEG